jgi:peroxiredoxin Q/BCP
VKGKGTFMSTLKEGEKAPGFRLPSDDGREIALEDFRGQHLFIFFFVKALTPG